MLAALACIALQTSPLGAHPKIWENKKLHIRMSYPREWHSVKIKPDEDHEGMRTLFRAEPNGPGTTGFEIEIYPEPPTWLVTAFPMWPKSPFDTKAIVLQDLPNSPALNSPAEIEHIRGFISCVQSITTVTTMRVSDAASFCFRSPKGDYIQFVAYTTTYGGATPEPDIPHPTAAYQSALPTFNAIVHSITFTK